MLKSYPRVAIYIREGKYPLPRDSHSSIQLLSQMDPDLNSLHKTCFFVIPTQGTNRIDDLIHLLQGFAVHMLIEFPKVCLDLLVLEAAIFVISIVQHLQDALGVIGVLGLQVIQLLVEGGHKLIHLHRRSPPCRLQARRIGLRRGVAGVQFELQIGSGRP